MTRMTQTVTKLWKLRHVSDLLNDAYCKYYTPSGHLAAYEIIVHFKKSVVLKQYIPKKQKCM